MVEVGRQNKGLKEQIGAWAKKTGLQYNRSLLKVGNDLTPSDSPNYKLRVHEKIRPFADRSNVRTVQSEIDPMFIRVGSSLSPM